MEFLSYLRCPLTKNSLKLIHRSEFAGFSIPESFESFGSLNQGLIDSSLQYFYPVFGEIVILHEQYALYLGNGSDQRSGLSFDKQRVFDYYNEISYTTGENLSIYEDSPKWVDFRDVSSTYIKNSFTRAAGYYPATGRYLLDIASGPIGLEEYMDLSSGYEYRICVDITIQALVQARNNMIKAGKSGIFICGDITNIPMVDHCCDTVLSQHTLYHIPKNDQLTAVNEMYRVAKVNSKIVIIYNWFYHSWFMNLSLNVIQVYRILRHFAGKLYVRLVKSKPRLYFYPHSPRWFRKSFAFGKEMEFFCWRSTNKHFLNLYIHRWLRGEKILQYLMKLENRYSKFMSTFGDYPVIVITKKEKSN